MKNQRISLMVFAAWTALLGSNLYAAVITYSGTVNYVDYDEETVTSAALPSGSVSVYDEDGDILLISASDITDGTFSFTINNADAGYQTGTSLGFLITGESIDGIGELVPVNCPYITVGIFDIDSLYFEIYSQRLVEYITTAYVDEGSEEHTAILIARLKNATETPFISSLYGGGSLAYTNIVDAIQDADPTLFIGLIDETVAHNAGLGLEFPVSATVTAALPGYALSTETVRFYPLSPVLQATSVASLKWGAEITGTAVYVDGNDDDVPLASGYIKLLDWDDTFWDGCEIMGADSGEFSLISPASEDMHLLIRGAVDGGFTMINSHFFDVPSNLTIDAGELEMVTPEEVEAALSSFNETFSLTIGEADYNGTGLIAGIVTRLACSGDTCTWEPARGVSIGITDSEGTPIEHYILYLDDDELADSDATSSAGGFVIMIVSGEEDFPLDVTFTAQASRSSIEDFSYETPVQARVYAYGSQAEGIVTAAPVQVLFNEQENILLFDGDDGGRCFITTSSWND